MSSLENDLKQRLEEIHQQGLYRQLRLLQSPQGTRIRVGDQTLLNFSSNDYLGLANHPALQEAAQRAIATFGAGAGASRLVCGSMQVHRDLEDKLASFKKTEAALTFSSGYSAALGLLSALLEPGDLLFSDKQIHACWIDAARLSRATVRVFGHNDLADLESQLKEADASSSTVARRPRKLIVTESVFSMDGDFASLRELAQLKEKYGAWLLVDEAHAIGIFGENRRGLAEAFELEDQVDIHMGTLGKALGAAGGYVCGSRRLIELLINKARTFIFSTAPPPPAAAAATAAIDVVQSEEGNERRAFLWARVDDVKNGLINGRWTMPPVRSAILPLVIGSEEAAVQTADQLRELGVFIPAIRYPSVARGTARLRLTVSAGHSGLEVEVLLAALAICKSRESRQA